MEKPKPFLHYKCPKCGTIGTHKLVKSWRMTGKGDIKTRIEIYKCQDGCRRKWRRGVNLNLVSPKIKEELKQ